MNSQTFVSIDFETANPKRVSACSAGGCVIEGGEIIDSFSTLIKPPSEFGKFSPMNIRIHGITPDKVADAPSFGDLFPKFKARVEGRVVISYSKFDLSVINSLLDYYGRESNFKYVDVCSLAKEQIKGLPNYKLPTVAKYLGLGEFKHHDATEDAIMCAKVFLSLLQMDGNGVCEDCVKRKESFADAFNGFAFSIVEDGIVDYKEAIELMWFLEVLPSVDVVNRLRQSVADFLADGEITQGESDILTLQLGAAAEFLEGKPHIGCSVCGGPIPKGMNTPCPWCMAKEQYMLSGDGEVLGDDAEAHLDAISAAIEQQ